MKTIGLLASLVSLLLSAVGFAQESDSRSLPAIKKVEIRNRAFYVNGQPFFPLMAWLQDTQNLAVLKSCGMNATAGYAGPRGHKSIEAYLAESNVFLDRSVLLSARYTCRNVFCDLWVQHNRAVAFVPTDAAGWCAPNQPIARAAGRSRRGPVTRFRPGWRGHRLSLLRAKPTADSREQNEKAAPSQFFSWPRSLWRRNATSRFSSR